VWIYLPTHLRWSSFIPSACSPFLNPSSGVNCSDAQVVLEVSKRNNYAVYNRMDRIKKYLI
jgi:hypothetical protein